VFDKSLKSKHGWSEFSNVDLDPYLPNELKWNETINITIYIFFNYSFIGGLCV
jgi:hypothetical protein